MQDKRLKINNRFMILEYVICAIIIYCNLASIPSIVSSSFTFSFIALAAFFLYKLTKKDGVYSLYGLIFSILWVSLVCVLINSFADHANLTFNNLKNYLMFCSTIIFMFLMLNIRTDRKTADKILIFNIFIAALYPIAYRYFPQHSAHRDLTLNFSNPNLAGMWILQSLLYLVLAILILKPKLLKSLAAIIFALNFILLEETAARNCMIALILFIAICVWIFFKQNPKFSKPLIFGVNILPISFLFIYLKLIDIVVANATFDFLLGEGKSLTSRVEIWERNLRKLENCWLIGSYYTAAGNTHNAHLVILGSFGAVTLILSIWFMYKLCSIVNNQCTSKKSLSCLTAFFAVIFMGFGEGALFSGAMGLYIMACGFIYLARCDFSKEPNDTSYDIAERSIK